MIRPGFSSFGGHKIYFYHFKKNNKNLKRYAVYITKYYKNRITINNTIYIYSPGHD